ncbi:uncharacterized protein LOC109712708 isoform X1 [Ananas comosus]|nr:uncharacterized protein LOC109712708 isoform X1 [Ananas comosus]XP_020092035.1 uncharacterized protein LOC109712708 isoform X1 [Ananas comosus]XP_020092036.1 uncharacterized protein LOC109712708 isoform X1 [Ananas comosus]
MEEAEEYLELNDLLENQESANQLETLTLSLNVPENDAYPEDPGISLEDILKYPYLIDDDMIDLINEPGGNPSLVYSPRSPSQNDAYIELNDFADTVNGLDGGSNLRGLLNFDEPELLSIPDNSGGSYSGESAQRNVVFYDEPGDDTAMEEDDYLELNDLLYSPIASLSRGNVEDDLTAYFNEADENSHRDNVSSKKKSNFTQEVDGVDVTSRNATPEALEPHTLCGESSSARVPEVNNHMGSENVDFNNARGNDASKKPIGKQLAKILESISAPPAFAAEFPPMLGKSIGPILEAHSTGSIRITADMIQIGDYCYSLQKNKENGSALSSSMVSNIPKRTTALEPIKKIQHGAMSLVLRGGFCLFFLSAVILIFSCKLRTWIYSR